MITLFEDDFETESASLQALSIMQEHVMPFVRTQLASRPLTKNNERAAILCSSLIADESLTEAILKELEDPEVQQSESLTTYLVLACTHIPEKLHSRFSAICGKISDDASKELERVLNSC